MNPAKVVENLLELARKLEAATDPLTTSEMQRQKETLEQVAEEVAQSWCGSWLGYHSRTYLHGFRRVSGSDFFDLEWGLRQDFPSQTTAEWVAFGDQDVQDMIISHAGLSNLDGIAAVATASQDTLGRLKGQLCAILSALVQIRPDEYLAGLKTQAAGTPTFLTASSIANQFAPNGQVMTRDSAASSAGFQTPPHISVMARVRSFYSPIVAGKMLSEIARQAADYLQITDHLEVGNVGSTGNKIFIGHGRSPVWRELKDFLTGRLHLEHEEFDRECVAGVNVTDRLTEMLDTSAFAFLVLTAEDEQNDGSLRARENVVHEVGLFQGRCGFRRAIVLLEDGCSEFSNIRGLIHIPFAKGNLSGAFEEIRRVLEREGFVKP